MPDKTLAQKKTNVKGGKHSKERLTVLLACSATGEKLKPLVIGKANNPRAFKGIDTTHAVRSVLESQQQSMAEPNSFTEWLQDVNRRKKVRERKILLYMDHVSSHVASDVSLSNVTIHFWPLNTMHLMPTAFRCWDNEDFQASFQKVTSESCCGSMDDSSSATELAKKFYVLHAVNWIATYKLEESFCRNHSKMFRSRGFKWSDQEEEVPEALENAQEDVQLC